MASYPLRSFIGTWLDGARVGVYARTHTPSPHATRVCHMYQSTVENGGMSRHLIQCIGAQIRVGLGVEIRNGRSFVAQTRLDAKLIKITARQARWGTVVSFSLRGALCAGEALLGPAKRAAPVRRQAPPPHIFPSLPRARYKMLRLRRKKGASSGSNEGSYSRWLSQT